MTTEARPEDAAWSEMMFAVLAEGGTWGVPRSGLVFTKREGKLVLTAAMPFEPGMPGDADDLREYQDADYGIIKRAFEAAGIEVERAD